MLIKNFNIYKLAFLLLTFFVYSKVMSTECPQLIEEIIVHKNTVTIVPNTAFTETFLSEPYFFAEYDEHLDLSILDKSVLIIPFLGITAPFIWATNSLYSIPCIDEDYFNALQKIKTVYKILYPSLSWSGEILPEKIVKNKRNESNNPHHHNKNKKVYGVLFSGGLDAVCTSFAHFGKQQRLITICGGDIRPGQEHMWQQVKQQAYDFAFAYGHSNSFVRSNFLTILNHDYLNTLSPEISAWWAHTSQSMSYCSLVAPLVIAENFDALLIASTRTIEYPYAYGTHPLIDNEICYAGIHVVHDGAELDRMGKVQLIKKTIQEQHIAPPLLRVCWGKDFDGGNCCECEKCLRTMNELLVEGENFQKYGFSIPVSTLITRTKNYFKTKISMRAGLWWHWGCVLKRIHERLEEENRTHTILFNENIRNYLLWLSRVDLDAVGCNKEKKIVLEQQKMLLRYLWNKSLETTRWLD